MINKYNSDSLNKFSVCKQNDLHTE